MAKKAKVAKADAKADAEQPADGSSEPKAPKAPKVQKVNLIQQADSWLGRINGMFHVVTLIEDGSFQILFPVITGLILKGVSWIWR